MSQSLLCLTEAKNKLLAHSQDPDNGNPGYCQCNNGQNYIFQSGSDPCPYTTIPPSSDLVTKTTTKLSPTVPPPSTKTLGTAPGPTASILIIWDVPPRTGQPFYDFYQVPAGFTKSLDNGCGSITPSLMPFWHSDDPKQGRVDKIRPNYVVRQAPGKLGTLKGFPNNCVYEENAVGNGKIACDNNIKIPCNTPSADLANKIEPDNGACSGIRYVRTLIMVVLP